MRSEPEDINPTGDVDGYIQLIFSSSDKQFKELLRFSKDCDHAIIFAYFTNTDIIIEHLYNIQKYRHIIDKVLIDKSDRVATKEIMQLMEYEKTLLNKAVSVSLSRIVMMWYGSIKVKSVRLSHSVISTNCSQKYAMMYIHLRQPSITSCSISINLVAISLRPRLSIFRL